MDELMTKTTAALNKQLELLTESGISSAEKQDALTAIAALTALLQVLNNAI